MSHKNKVCLKVQAREIFKNLQCLGRSKHDDKVQAGRDFDRLKSADNKYNGLNKMEYINEQLRDKIYSIKTYETYAKHNNYFIAVLP